MEAWRLASQSQFPDSWRKNLDFLVKLRNVWKYDFVTTGNTAYSPNISFSPTSLFKVDDDILEQMRNTFNSSVRTDFLKSLGNDPNIIPMIKKAEFDESEIPSLVQRLQNGYGIPGYQVHHKIPLDLGGSNALSNLVLIKQTPYHSAITSYHNAVIKRIITTDPQVLDFPSIRGNFYSPPYIE